MYPGANRLYILQNIKYGRILKNKLEKDLEIKPIAYLPASAEVRPQSLGISWPRQKITNTQLQCTKDRTRTLWDKLNTFYSAFTYPYLKQKRFYPNIFFWLICLLLFKIIHIQLEFWASTNNQAIRPFKPNARFMSRLSLPTLMRLALVGNTWHFKNNVTSKAVS